VFDEYLIKHKRSESFIPKSVAPKKLTIRKRQRKDERIAHQL